MTYTTLVSTELLAAHLDASAIVDCRFDLQREAWGREEYLAGHIPGAVYAHLNEDLSSERTGRNGRHPLPAVDALAATLSRFGIDRDTQVVVYDQDAGLFASRLWWLLKYLGHDVVALLDGGWAKWTRERRPTRSGPESRRATAFTPSPKPEMRIAIDDVMARLEDRATLLVDARATDRFEGRAETIDPVAGHIPGAINHFYKWNVTDEGTMRPADVLRENFERLLGGRTPDQAVMYCGSGVSACHNLLAMEHAGLPGAKLYPGSWSEWSSDPSRPIETGPAKPHTR
jgi:thiosulfate/3-mercaptopyruvate sulfurtransferase